MLEIHLNTRQATCRTQQAQSIENPSGQKPLELGQTYCFWNVLENFPKLSIKHDNTLGNADVNSCRQNEVTQELLWRSHCHVWQAEKLSAAEINPSCCISNPSCFCELHTGWIAAHRVHQKWSLGAFMRLPICTEQCTGPDFPQDHSSCYLQSPAISTILWS